ncbi:hypothetical protein Nepgr_032660 [Nepenthes gracilis]|uniref:Uncharacterized protein n=1 Tax=Nepenthes gracilis TaxID=150966 RepID=A0AAD3TJV9_NEPGR|nr:hypothetical protein Nepgr_032660 [Nepenthes gracilis]
MVSLGTIDSDLSVATGLDHLTNLPIRSTDPPMCSDLVPCAEQMQSIPLKIINEIPSPEEPISDACTINGNDSKLSRSIIDSNHDLCRAEASSSKVAVTIGVTTPISYLSNARKIQN